MNIVLFFYFLGVVLVFLVLLLNITFLGKSNMSSGFPTWLTFLKWSLLSWGIFVKYKKIGCLVSDICDDLK